VRQITLKLSHAGKIRWKNMTVPLERRRLTNIYVKNDRKQITYIEGEVREKIEYGHKLSVNFRYLSGN
jgi:hypothetical protein